MININLLPYRQNQKRQAQKAFGIALLAVIVAVAAILGGSYAYIEQRIQSQGVQNQTIELAIVSLNVKSKSFKEIQAQKKAIIERLQLIETLQAKRTQVLDMLSHWPSQLPDGVHFALMKREGDRFVIKGWSENHQQVSELMRKMEALPLYRSIGLAQVNASQEKAHQGLQQFLISAQIVLAESNKNEEQP